MLVLLGNTGNRYEKTRHNVGWRLAEREPFRRAAGWQQKFKADWTKVVLGGESVVLLLPRTMMNLSGESVQAAARFFRLDPQAIVVAHDDTELPFATIELRKGGGYGGHNGLKSVAHCLSDGSFWRLRIGVGRPPHGELHGHVLGRFSSEEEAELSLVLEAAAAMLEKAFADGFPKSPIRHKCLESLKD